jgi:hypothetical protein
VKVVRKTASAGAEHNHPPDRPSSQHAHEEIEGALVLALGVGRPTPIAVKVVNMPQRARELVAYVGDGSCERPRPREHGLEDRADISHLFLHRRDHSVEPKFRKGQDVAAAYLIANQLDRQRRLMLEYRNLPAIRIEVRVGIGN